VISLHKIEALTEIELVKLL